MLVLVLAHYGVALAVVGIFVAVFGAWAQLRERPVNGSAEIQQPSSEEHVESDRVRAGGAPDQAERLQPPERVIERAPAAVR